MHRLSRLEKQVLAGFIAAVLALLGAAGAIYLTTSGLVSASRHAVTDAEVLAMVERVALVTYQAKAAQRGYLLSNDEALLAERAEAAQAAEAALTELREEAVATAPELGVVADLAEERLELLEAILVAYLEEGAAAARELLAAGLGRPQMRELRDRAEAAISERQRLLEFSADAAAAGSRAVNASLVVGLLFAVALFIILMLLIRRALRELRRSSASLAASQARLEAVVETAVDPIIVIDKHGIMESFNRAAERVFGYAAAEAVGRNVAMLMPSPDRERHDGYMEHYLRTGEKRIIGVGREVLALRKSGQVFPAELAVAEFRADGDLRFSGIIRDISERKRAERRQQELMRDLEAANEELTNFAYVASHDLKAPLRAIGSLADWISTDYADKFDDEGREQMRLLIGRVRRMDRLIDGILQYSRVGRVREAQTRVELNELLADVVDLLEPPSHIQVEVDRLPTVQGERARIHQVFQNLLSNAIRYMDKPEGRVHIGCSEEGAMWRFSVADNGPGIEERHRERIFQLFQTLAPRDRTESTGIGLSLVKKIVELYGGRVWLESTPGQGTTFYFTWPKQAGESAS